MCVITFFGCNTYVKFKPISFDGKNFKKGNSDISNDYRQRIIKVFKYYKVDFKIKNDSTIWIDKKLMKNEELIWNYTTKSNDLEWLKNR